MHFCAMQVLQQQQWPQKEAIIMQCFVARQLPLQQKQQQRSEPKPIAAFSAIAQEPAEIRSRNRLITSNASHGSPDGQWTRHFSL